MKGEFQTMNIFKKAARNFTESCDMIYRNGGSL